MLAKKTAPRSPATAQRNAFCLPTATSIPPERPARSRGRTKGQKTGVRVRRSGYGLPVRFRHEPHAKPDGQRGSPDTAPNTPAKARTNVGKAGESTDRSLNRIRHPPFLPSRHGRRPTDVLRREGNASERPPLPLQQHQYCTIIQHIMTACFVRPSRVRPWHTSSLRFRDTSCLAPILGAPVGTHPKKPKLRVAALAAACLRTLCLVSILAGRCFLFHAPFDNAGYSLYA